MDHNMKVEELLGPHTKPIPHTRGAPHARTPGPTWNPGPTGQVMIMMLPVQLGDPGLRSYRRMADK